MTLPGAKVRPKMTDSVRGAFGLFTNTGNLQIAYVSTRFKPEDLRLLKTVRQVVPRHVLRIRELMQRDIDDERVRSEVVRYLTPVEGVRRTRFFPPIVAAALPRPTEPDFRLKDLYPSPLDFVNGKFPRVKDDNEGVVYEERFFGNSMGFRIPMLGDSPSEDSELFHGCEFSWNRDKLTLVAIDGQHRLLALKAILGILEDEDRARGYESCFLDDLKQDALGFSSIPVCIVSPWMLFEGNLTLEEGDEIAPVFRQIFVDVNKNAKTVSECRNILLDEQDLVSVFTRNIVDQFLVEAQLPLDESISEENLALYQFEWDSPDGKEFQINDLRAISSVGLLNKIVRTSLMGKELSEDDFRTCLCIEEGDPELDPIVKQSLGVDPVELGSTKFATWQRPVLETRFRSMLQPCFVETLRNIYASRNVIERLEEKRLALLKQQSVEKGNSIPKFSLDFLLGSKGDQKQIREMSSHQHPVGKFDPEVCKAVVKQIGNDFLRKQIEPMKAKNFSRLFFSRVGQTEFFNFLLLTLKQNLHDESRVVEFCREYCRCFNSAFEKDDVAKELFCQERDWNNLLISTLGTQTYKFKHIGGLLKISLCFFTMTPELDDLFGGKWEKTRNYLATEGLKQIQSGLQRRLPQQIGSSGAIRNISDEKKRRAALDKKVRERVEEISQSLIEFIHEAADFELSAT